jgi:hypothetical protein
VSLGDVNKGTVLLLLVLVCGAAGYLWYSQLYKPAVAERVAATAAASTADQGLVAARAQLEEAQRRLEAQKQEAGAVDDSVSRLNIARAAIPPQELIDDAAIVLGDMAERSGIDTRISVGGDGGDTGGGAGDPGLQGATPIDLEIEAAGTWLEMIAFMRSIESSAEVTGSKLYSRGRLFNVTKLEIGEQDDAQPSDGGVEVASTENLDELVVGPNDLSFTLTVRMYTSSDANSVGVGTAAADPAASPTEAPAGTTPDASTTPPAGDGAQPSGATAGSGAPGTTPDPGTGGAAPAATPADPSAAPATGAAPADPAAASPAPAATDPGGQ